MVMERKAKLILSREENWGILLFEDDFALVNYKEMKKNLQDKIPHLEIIRDQKEFERLFKSLFLTQTG